MQADSQHRAAMPAKCLDKGRIRASLVLQDVVIRPEYHLESRISDISGSLVDHELRSLDYIGVAGELRDSFAVAGQNVPQVARCGTFGVC